LHEVQFAPPVASKKACHASKSPGFMGIVVGEAVEGEPVVGCLVGESVVGFPVGVRVVGELVTGMVVGGNVVGRRVGKVVVGEIVVGFRVGDVDGCNEGAEVVGLNVGRRVGEVDTHNGMPVQLTPVRKHPGNPRQEGGGIPAKSCGFPERSSLVRLLGGSRR
jgi:hypothetical protein